MTKGQSVLPKRSAKKFCQHIRPKHSAKTFGQNIRPKHSAKTFGKTFSQNIRPKCSAKMFCQNVLLKCYFKVFCHILSKFFLLKSLVYKSRYSNELRMFHSTFGFGTNFLIFALAECEKCTFSPLLLLAQPFLWSWNKQLAGRDCLKTHHKLSFKKVSAN